MHKTQPRGPYIFSGYSFGVPVSMEMAAQLEQQSEQCIMFLLDGGVEFGRLRMFNIGMDVGDGNDDIQVYFMCVYLYLCLEDFSMHKVRINF